VRWTDKRIETWVAVMLRTGVMVAAAVVLAGGVLYLSQNRGLRTNFHQFHGEPAHLLHLRGIGHGLATGDARSIIMLGLLLLIATPVARVGMCVAGFAFERDRLYVAVSSVVMVILLYSLIFHR
jgi:uncharacterized membrane protein